MISVILPTSRPGGMDVTFLGLSQQTYNDFELVWVDSIRPHREKFVRDHIARASFPVTYVEPLDNPFPVSCFARCANTGIAHAKGDILLFTQDYLWFPPECLEKHALFHREHPNAGFMGPHTYLVDPPMKPIPLWDEQSYWDGNVTARDWIKYCYDVDLRAGFYDKIMWSAFVRDLTHDPRWFYAPHPTLHNVDVKMEQPSGPSDHRVVHLKNESVPTENVLAINGFDEGFNGAHGWQDTEFAERLSSKGLAWHHDQDNKVYGFNGPKETLPRLRYNRPRMENEKLIRMKRSTGFSEPVNDWNLREFRRSFTT
jgi:glycosyltransferase involved in cell wall biosynthesis